MEHEAYIATLGCIHRQGFLNPGVVGVGRSVLGDAEIFKHGFPATLAVFHAQAVGDVGNSGIEERQHGIFGLGKVDAARNKALVGVSRSIAVRAVGIAFIIAVGGINAGKGKVVVIVAVTPVAERRRICRPQVGGGLEVSAFVEVLNIGKLAGRTHDQFPVKIYISALAFFIVGGHGV